MATTATNVTVFLQALEPHIQATMTKAFALTLAHLRDPAQVRLAQHLERAALHAYTHGPPTIQTTIIHTLHTRHDLSPATVLAAAIRGHISATLSHTADPTLSTAIPVVRSCFTTLLHDACLELAYKLATDLPAAPCVSADLHDPRPFYTLPFTPGGRFLGGGAAAAAFDQAARLQGSVWSRAAGEARPFPYAWPMTPRDWADPATVANLNRVWGYWMARNGYAGVGEHTGAWGREERNYVVAMCEAQPNMHDLDIVRALNEYLEGKNVTLEDGREVAFRERGVAGMRAMVREKGLLPERRALWDREWEEDMMRGRGRGRGRGR